MMLNPDYPRTQTTMTLFMADSNKLVSTIKELILNEYEITTVTHLQEMKKRHDGVVYTDWLIIYK